MMMWPMIAAFLVTSTPNVIDGNLISVDAAGFGSDEGRVVVALFDRESWSNSAQVFSAIYTETCSIVGDSIHVDIRGVAHGQYVVLVFHDLDSNDSPGWGEEVGITGGCSELGEGGSLSFDDLSIMNKGQETCIDLIVSSFGG